MDTKPQGHTLEQLVARLRRSRTRHKNGVSRYFGPTILIKALPRAVIHDQALVRFDPVNGCYQSRSARIECVVGTDEKWIAVVRPAGAGLKDGVKIEVVPRTS